MNFAKAKLLVFSVVTLGGYYAWMRHRAKQMAMYTNPALTVNAKIPFDPATLLRHLGGAGNVREVSASLSKLTVLVFDKTKVDKTAIAALGSTGSFESGNILNFVFGNVSKPLAAKLKQLVEAPAAE